MNRHARLGIALIVSTFFLAGTSMPASAYPFWKRFGHHKDSKQDKNAKNSKESKQEKKDEDDDDGDNITFIKSDDYSDSDEVVGAFLHDADYTKMHEDFTLQGSEFDWGWEAPNVNLAAYKTVHVSVVNKSDSLDPDIDKTIAESFGAAMQRLGLTEVASADKADLDLGLALVDYKADSTYAFVTVIKPFVELELRLKDRKTGQDLLLIRNQEHSASPKQAAIDSASELLGALRKRN